MHKNNIPTVKEVLKDFNNVVERWKNHEMNDSDMVDFIFV